MAFFNFGNKSKEKESNISLREETSGLFGKIASVLDNLKLNAEAMAMKLQAEKIMKYEDINAEKAIKKEALAEERMKRKMEYNEAHVHYIYPIVKSDSIEFSKYKNNAEDIAHAKARVKRLTKDIELIEKKQEDFSKIITHMCTHPNDMDVVELGEKVKHYFDKNNSCIIIINEETCKRNNEVQKENPNAKPNGIGVAVYDLDTNCTRIYSSVEEFGRKNLKYQDCFKAEAIEKKLKDGNLGLEEGSDIQYDGAVGAVEFISKFPEDYIDNLNQMTKLYFGLSDINEVKKLPLQRTDIIEGFLIRSNTLMDSFLTYREADLKRESDRIDNGMMHYADKLAKSFQKSNNILTEDVTVHWDKYAQTVTIKSPAITEEGKKKLNGNEQLYTELVLSYTNKGIESVHYISENANENPVKVYDRNDKSKGLLDISNASYEFACRNGMALERFFNLEGKSVNLTDIEKVHYKNASKRSIGEAFYHPNRVGIYDMPNPAFSYPQDIDDKVGNAMQAELEKYKKMVGKTMSVTYNPYNNSINIENNNSVVTLLYDKQDTIPIGIAFNEDKT